MIDHITIRQAEMGNFDRPWPTLSLSASAIQTECWRAVFWKTYWSWGGWRDNAPPSRRLAYALKNGLSAKSEAGRAVHRTAARIARLRAAGQDAPTLDASTDATIADWRSALGAASQIQPTNATKQRPMSLDTYYSDTVDYHGAEQTIRDSMVGLYATSVRHLDRLFVPGASPEVKVLSVDTLQSWPVLDGAGTVYVAADLAWSTITEDAIGPIERIHIVDWKTGRPKGEHQAQLYLYAAWAYRLPPRVVGGAPNRVVSVRAEYLTSTEDSPAIEVGTTKAAQAEAGVLAYAKRLRPKLVGGDLSRNEPLMGPDHASTTWAQLPEGSRPCSWCAFRRLCNR